MTIQWSIITSLYCFRKIIKIFTDTLSSVSSHFFTSNFFLIPRGVPRNGEIATAQDRIKVAEAAIRKLQFDKRKIDLEIQKHELDIEAAKAELQSESNTNPSIPVPQKTKSGEPN